MEQCKISGKALDVVAALLVEDSLDYNLVKVGIMRAYELVPEAYHQKFCKQKKNIDQTYVEVTREKGTLVDEWTNSCKVFDYDSLRDLILLEDFKRYLPHHIVVCLNEKKVTSCTSAAVLADEYTLTHKSVFSSSSVSGSNHSQSPPKEGRKCFCCHKLGYLIANCLSLRWKE